MNAPDSAITAICDEYRHQWSPDNSGPLAVARFLKRHPAQQANHQLFTGLSQSDMESIWSHWSNFIETQVHSEQPIPNLLKAWKRLPQFPGYESLVSSPEAQAQFRLQLANCESQCRDRWGDAVGSLFYEHHYQIKTQEFAKRVRRHVRCEFENNDDYSEVLFPLRGFNEIGRQRTRDVHPYFFESNPDGNRIVVANRFEAEVSRQQLTLQLLSPMVAIVHNRSSVNAIRISPLDIIVPCEQSIALIFPFTIHLPGRRLCCY